LHLKYIFPDIFANNFHTNNCLQGSELWPLATITCIHDSMFGNWNFILFIRNFD